MSEEEAPDWMPDVLPDAMARLRDEAIRDHRDGNTESMDDITGGPGALPPASRYLIMGPDGVRELVLVPTLTFALADGKGNKLELRAPGPPVSTPPE